MIDTRWKHKLKVDSGLHSSFGTTIDDNTGI